MGQGAGARVRGTSKPQSITSFASGNRNRNVQSFVCLTVPPCPCLSLSVCVYRVTHPHCYRTAKCKKGWQG